MRNNVDKFSVASDNFGWTTTLKKTEVIHEPMPRKPFVEPNITIKRQWLKVLEKFLYLSIALSKSIVVDDEVNTRLTKASAAFGRIDRNEWNRKGISEPMEINVYRTVVLITLPYGCETWTTYQQYMKKLNHFHTTCLRKILGITWQKHISNTEVLTRASLPSIYTILLQSQLRCASHIVCMKDHRYPKKLLFNELSQGKRSHGDQRKHFKDTQKISIKSFGMTTNSGEKLSNVEHNPVKQEGTQQVSSAKSLERHWHNRLCRHDSLFSQSKILPCTYWPH